MIRHHHSLRALRQLAFACALALAFTQTGHAQNYLLQTGAPTFTTADPVPMGFVNIANGNLHIEIPIASVPQRGSLTYAAKLVYDSRIWRTVFNGTSWVWQPDNVPDSDGGWRLVTPGTYREDTDANVNTCFVGATQYTWWQWYRFRYTEPNGTVRKFPVYYEQTVPCHTAVGNTLAGSSLDGSGYAINVSTDAVTPDTILDPHGTSLPALPFFPPLPMDTNGNFLVSARYENSLWNATDTLNRTPLQSNYNSVTNQITYTVLTPGGGTANIVSGRPLMEVCTNFGQAFVTEYCSAGDWTKMLTVITSLALPDGTSYSFNYDGGRAAGNYGLLTSMTLPTGGVVNFGYTTFTDANGNVNRWVSSRSFGAGTWTYTPAVCGPNCQQVTATKPSGDQTLYTFNLNNGAWNTTMQSYTGSVAGGNLQMTVQNTFDTSLQDPIDGGGAFTRLTQTTTTLPAPGGNLVKQTQYAYDLFTYNYRGTNYTGSRGKLTSKSEYTFGIGSPGGLTRKTAFSYLDDGSPTYQSKNIVDRVTDVKVMDGSGTTTLAETTIGYDNYALTSVTGMSHHDDANYGTTNTVRGNPTAISRRAGGTNWLGTSLSYDTTGQVISISNFDGPVGTITYSPTLANAYPTTVTNMLGHANNFNYDFNTGLVTSSTDPNNQATSFSYDNMKRPTRTGFPDGGSVTTTYTSATQRDISTALTATSSRQDQIVLDGLGRVIRKTLVSDPAGADLVDTSYDSSGRVASVSNPYRTSSTGGESYGYDGLNRTTSVTHGDGNSVSTFYGAAVALNGGASTQLCAPATYGLGYPTLFKDEAGKKRQTWTDGLGRTIEADEPDASGVLTLGTCYTYDLLDNLTQVNQGGQIRSYTYDPLSRLTSATTPESGTTNFYYTLPSGWPYCSTDLNAVCRRTDARGITTTYWYDPLRLGAKIYSDGTPTASFYYDEPNHNFAGNLRTLTNTKGRLSRTWNGSGETVFSCDSVGRVTDHWSCPGGCGAQFYPNYSRAYDLAGDATSWANLSGGALTYTINAAQQVSQVRSDWPGTTMPDATFTYTPFGAISTFVNGCIGAGCPPGQETNDYNSRLQLVRTQVGTAATPSANTCLVYNYYSVANPTSCVIPGQGTANNGNVVGYFYQDNSNPSLSHTATYAYDSLNRLASSVATGSATHNLSFSYDRWGNMACVTDLNTNGPCPNWTFNTTSNRISTAGFTYDAAGNLTADGTGVGTHTYQWDGEGRLKSVDNGATATYYYNALGQRVQKQPGSGAPADYRYYYYDASGQLISVQSQTAQLDHFYPALAGRLWGEHAGYFIHPNALGSTGMVMNAYGLFGQYGVLTDELYYPWGQGWQVAGSTWWDRFASLERRDPETALDPTLFRTYASDQGRWLSPDPLTGDITNPQSLNRYAYVLNSPTNLIDPLGLQCSDVVNGTIHCTSSAPAPRDPFLDEFFLRGLFGFLFDSGLRRPWLDRDEFFRRRERPEPDDTPAPAPKPTPRPIPPPFGEDFLGSLGQFFRGRPPGQSFGACVSENVSLTTFGLVQDPVKVGSAALVGLPLTVVKVRGITRPDLLVPLSTFAGSFVGFASRALSGGLISSDAAFLIGRGTAQGIAVAGGAGFGLLVGSAANCASGGVTR